ncbi:hypothetical protein [Microbulbifer halophilus]|uniref:Uncharacterized protein n=1 Tax=Microbulbifer halophilus TaxID=453963 RepID=A0ABW5EK50_9GAMM|nr:hypothetical protein [Microbulbifer halophilus]MCW8128607.1 hypothetical protein [Microbulbifer halophilus]
MLPDSPGAITEQSSMLSDCPSGVLRVVDGYDASIVDSGFELLDNGIYFETALKGPSPEWSPDHYRRAWLSPNSYGYGASLAYEVRGCTDECDSSDSSIYMQKVNHHILYSDPNEGLNFGERRHIGFAFRASQDQPIRDTIIFQLWQGSPHGPPLAGKLRTEGDGSLSLVLLALNNDTGSNPSASRIEVGKVENLAIGTWYSVTISLFPEHTEMEHREGNTTVGFRYKRIDETYYHDAFAYHGKWGYIPGSSCQYAGGCEKLGANNKIDFKIGIYRKAEDTTLQVRFDNIKLTKSLWQSKPEYWCTWY